MTTRSRTPDRSGGKTATNRLSYDAAQEVGVRLRDCEDVSPGVEERPPLKDVTKQGSECRDWEQKSVCDSDL
jgi:hypothetical protein